jgi:hypothetical protein
MSLQKSKKIRIIGGAASLALLLAMGTVNAGKPDGSSPNNKGGASVAVSNTCELVSIAGKPALRVTTTITNKSSGDASPDFTENGTKVRAKEKGKGKDKYEQVGEKEIFTGALGVTVKDIQLCDGSGAYLGPDDTVSLNASVSVNVDNDNKGEYSNRCSDDPDTDNIDEGKVVVSADELNQLCMLP